MRHLPAITHRLPSLLARLPAHRHAPRRLLLAGRRDVSPDVMGSRHADGLLRRGDVVRYVAGEGAWFMRGDGRGHRTGTPGCFYGRCRATVNRSPCFSGKRQRKN